MQLTYILCFPMSNANELDIDEINNEVVNAQREFGLKSKVLFSLRKYACDRAEYKV